jgi:hypothetical protein
VHYQVLKEKKMDWIALEAGLIALDQAMEVEEGDRL